jgi:uncharacterized protein YcgL (UPF0745 family)
MHPDTRPERRCPAAALPFTSSNTGAVGPPKGEVDAMNAFLAKIVAWITAGYPEGVPGPDRVPLMSLLNRRLSNDEVKAVARALTERGEFDHIDIGVLITQMTDELPREDDVERVRDRLAAKGWPLDDPRDDEASVKDDGEDSA